MKNFISLLLLGLCTTAAFSQFNFTQAHMPTAGDEQFYQMADTTAFNIGSSGTSQNWDYSTTIDSTDTFTLKYMSPAATPHGSSMSSADVASFNGEFEYNYYATTTSDWTWVGVADDLTLNQPAHYATDPGLVHQFPTSFNTPLADSVNTVYVVLGFNNHRTGEIRTTIDASGDITLPNGMTHNNVNRVETIIAIQDSSSTPLGTVINTFVITRYDWYDSTNVLPVMSYVHRSITFGSNNSEDLKIFYASTPPVNREAEAGITKLNVYPNPTSGYFQLDIRLNTNKEVNVSMFDLAGKVVKEMDLGKQSGFFSTKIDAENLKSGLYFVKVSTDEGEAIRKIVIE